MRPIIAANWKMNTTLTEALILATGVKEGLADYTAADVVLCPPSPWLVPVAEVLHTHKLNHLTLGAQNIFYQEAGAYTGEVSAAMLKGLAKWVIIGHSERRRYFKETNEEIVKKVALAFENGLRPIVCVGEIKKPSTSLLTDPSDLTAAQLRQPLSELEAVTRMLSHEQLEKLVVAYEPVWAISSNPGAQPANGHYANKVVSLLRRHLLPITAVLYGGSAKPDNAREFLSQPEINGLLVGGASLNIKDFQKICREAAG